MASTASSYDLFLSYNSADHTLVEEIARKIRDEHLEPFLDRWYLVPGARWRSRLEQILNSCKAVAIFVGPGEMGRWQQREVDVALDLQANCPSFPVIPVLLPGCEPPLGFLRQLSWVDLQNQALDQAIVILAKAARGEPPGPDLQRAFDSIRASVCPYRGLLHFREEDAPFFFGRQVAIDKLVDVVRCHPFVGVVGASGSGKSSVVRAGLVPKLRSDRNTAWEIVVLVPTDQPLKALARAFLPLLEPTMGEVDRLAEATKLAEHFRLGEISLSDIVESILKKQSGTDRVLIAVDQFEELYTLTTDEEARRRFLDEILAASSRVGSKVNVVLTLRGDFVGKALAYRPLSDRLQDAQINLGPMTREELECAIRKPAEKIQLEFEGGLVRRVLNDVGEEPGNLPLLEFVLKELWDNRHGGILLNETYDAKGGLQGAVAAKADELFKRLSSAEQKILQRIFLRIVRPSAESGLDTRRRAAFTELPREAIELVTKLANERLLVTNQSASGLEQTVEVAHEALISNWSTLRAWVNEDREFLLWRDRLSPLVAEWERAQESNEALLRGPLLIEAQKWFDQRSQDLSDQERKFISASRSLRERQRRRRAFTVAGAMTVVSTLLLLLFFMWRGANDQRIAAQASRVVAEEQSRIAQIAAQAAQRALTDDFFRTIGVSNAKIPPRDEREALWELAQVDRTNPSVRTTLLNRWFGTVDAFVRGETRDGQGFRAATGLNVEYHRLVMSNAIRLGGSVAAALENPQETESNRLSSLSDALAALANKMEPQAAAEIARRGAQRLIAALENLQQTESNRLLSLDIALMDLANKMEPRAAAEAAKGLATTLENTQEAESNRLASLGNALATLANKMEPQAAAEIARRGAQRLAAALESPQQTDPYTFFSLGNALATLANKMEPQAAAEIARRGAQRLAAALESPQQTDPYTFFSLGNPLAALANKMEPRAAAEVAKGLAEALENAQETESNRLSSLGPALAALANKMEPQAAAEIAKGLAEALENAQGIQPNRLLSLGNALATLANKMEPQAAAEIARRGAQRLATALENPQVTDSSLSSLGPALAALANKMEPQAAAEIARRGAQRLTAALENPQETQADTLSSLGDALAALANTNKMEPQVATELARRGAQRLTAALESPQHTDSPRPVYFGNALAAFANKMEPQAAADIAKRLAAALENQPEIELDRLWNLGDALETLANKIEPQAAADIAKGLAAALENAQKTDPETLLSLGNALAALANKMEPRAAAEIAKSLATALENPQETQSARLSGLGQSLAAICRLLPSTHCTHLLAISNMLLQPVSTEAGRKLLAEVCAQLSWEHLAEVLKYPFCTGEAEQIVLNQLKAKTKPQQDFGGDVLKFVEQADSLGIKDVDNPAQRPSAPDALKELDGLIGVVSAPTTDAK